MMQHQLHILLFGIDRLTDQVHLTEKHSNIVLTYGSLSTQVPKGCLVVFHRRRHCATQNAEGFEVFMINGPKIHIKLQPKLFYLVVGTSCDTYLLQEQVPLLFIELLCCKVHRSDRIQSSSDQLIKSMRRHMRGEERVTCIH